MMASQDPTDALESKEPSVVDEVLAKIEGIKTKGNAFFKQKDYHEAIARYDIAIEEYNAFLETGYDSDLTCIDDGDTDTPSEETSLPSHLSNAHNDAVLSKMKLMIGAVYNNRGFAYFRLEMFGQAVLDSTQSVKLKFAKAFYRRGCANMALGRMGKAKKDFAKAAAKFPKNKDIRAKLKLAKTAWSQEKFFAAIASEMGKPISDSIKLADFADPSKDPNYLGPKLIADDPESSINAKWIANLLEYQRDGHTLPMRYTVAIMLAALKQFKAMNNVEFFSLDESESKENSSEEEKNHVTICGDVHGQYYDFLHIFELNGVPSHSNAYLFNGDFVDRGSWSCEIIISMLALKVLYPRHFMMTRGNHETINMNNMYGFKGEVQHKYSAKVFDLFTELFNALPLCYVIGESIFVCHGGLMKKEAVKIEEIQSINRFQQPCEGVMTDIMWSDPQEQNGLAPSKRGGGTMFGPDITAAFLERNGLKLMVRSHEVQEEGYKVMHNGKLITIFSAPNYVDQMGNKGAFIRLDSTYEPKFTQFEAQKHPDLKPMAYGAGAFNMASFM